MFFDLKLHRDDSYQHCWKMGKYWLHTDDGWKEFHKDGRRAIAKGYSYEVPLAVAAFEPPRYRGIFCSVVETDNGLMITHGSLRGFMMFKDKTSVSNLRRLDPFSFLTYWVDGQAVSYNPLPRMDESPVTLAEATDAIYGMIKENIQGILTNNDVPELECTVTGGIDTTMIWSYLEAMGIPHRSTMTRHFAWDKFISDHKLELDDAAPWIDLNNLNHYLSETWITSGGNGDYAFWRDYGLIAPWLTANGVNMLAVTQRGDYMFRNIMKDPAYPRELKDPRLPNKSLLMDTLMHVIQNSTIWHVSNSMFFDPFLDARISLMLLRLHPMDLAKAISNVTIQREIIKRNAPWMADCINTYQNVNPRLHFFGKTDDTRHLIG